MSLLHFRNSDRINDTPVSLADPMPVDVSAGTTAFTASVAFTRPNDTSAYTANDVLGAATGATAALTFASLGPSGKNVLIIGSELEIDVSAVPSGMTSFLLHLYSVTPPSALGDNAAHDLGSGDRASYLGSLSLGTPVDLGSTLYVVTTSLVQPVLLASANLFGYLVTVGAFTPTAQAAFTVKLHALAI